VGTFRIADFRLPIGDWAGTYRATFFNRQSAIVNVSGGARIVDFLLTIGN
jgi:hypothetical protein